MSLGNGGSGHLSHLRNAWNPWHQSLQTLTALNPVELYPLAEQPWKVWWIWAPEAQWPPKSSCSVLEPSSAKPGPLCQIPSSARYSCLLVSAEESWAASCKRSLNSRALSLQSPQTLLLTSRRGSRNGWTLWRPTMRPCTG